MKNTVKTFQTMKEAGDKITEITCYDYTTAKLVEAAGINSILVGDSLGNMMLGYENTLKVTMEDMIHHGAAVARACSNTMVIVDMPFMSYQTSVYDAVVNAGRLVKEGGAHAVKLEGGSNVAEAIKAIVNSGIPVQGHIGMTPQTVNAMGGFKVQGRDEEAAKRILEDAYSVQRAGAFSVVLECVPPKLGTLIASKLSIPVIGIGAGSGCDGQVLVYQDMLGMKQGASPKFVKQFDNIGDRMINAFKNYKEEVETGQYPEPIHTYMKSDCTEEYLSVLNEMEI